jgi:hypothetical protein
MIVCGSVSATVFFYLGANVKQPIVCSRPALSPLPLALQFFLVGFQKCEVRPRLMEVVIVESFRFGFPKSRVSVVEAICHDLAVNDAAIGEGTREEVSSITHFGQRLILLAQEPGTAAQVVMSEILVGKVVYPLKEKSFILFKLTRDHTVVKVLSIHANRYCRAHAKLKRFGKLRHAR